MRKLLIFSLILTFALGAMAFASGTRVETMGNANMIVKDEANIWLFPSTVNYYPKVFVTEFDGGSFFKAGAHFMFGENTNPWVLAFYFTQDDYNHGIFEDYGWNTTDADHRITLFYGRNFNDMPFGFYFSWFKDGYTNEDTGANEPNNYEEGLNRFKFKLGLSPMQGKMDVVAGIGFTTWSDKDYYGGTTALEDYTKPSGNLELVFGGRYWMDPQGNYTPVIHGGIMYEKQGIDVYYDNGDPTDLDYTETYTDLMFEAGFGLNYDAAEDVLVVADFGLGYASYKDKYEPTGGTTEEEKWNDFVFPMWKLGIDAKVFKWLDLRAGVTNDWYWSSYEYAENEWKRSWNETDVNTYLGAGFHWGSLDIDASVDPYFLNDGPYFISGHETFDLFSRVSLLYWFD